MPDCIRTCGIKEASRRIKRLSVFKNDVQSVASVCVGGVLKVDYTDLIFISPAVKINDSCMLCASVTKVAACRIRQFRGEFVFQQCIFPELQGTVVLRH